MNVALTCDVCGRGRKGQAPPDELQVMRDKYPTPPQGGFKTDLTWGRYESIFTKAKWGKVDDVIECLNSTPPASQYEKFCYDMPPHLIKISDEDVPFQVNSVDSQGNTLLMCTLLNQHRKDEDGQRQCAIIEACIQKKADVNLRNKEGHTALHKAYAFQYTEAAELLLKHGAKETVKDWNGRTPKQYAEWLKAEFEKVDEAYRIKMQAIEQKRLERKKAAKEELMASSKASKQNRPGSAASKPSRPGSVASVASQPSE